MSHLWKVVLRPGHIVKPNGPCFIQEPESNSNNARLQRWRMIQVSIRYRWRRRMRLLKRHSTDQVGCGSSGIYRLSVTEAQGMSQLMITFMVPLFGPIL